MATTTTKSSGSKHGRGRIRQRVPAPDRLRGLAHPVRVRVLAALRTAGPSTATALAQRLGLNSGATSYHLRQLAAYGFIVEASDLGNRRDRFWKVPDTSAKPPAPVSQSRPQRGPLGDVEARAAYLQARLVEHTDAAQSAIEHALELDESWSGATDLTTHIVNLTPERAGRLMADIDGLIEAAVRDGEQTGSQPSHGNGNGNGKVPSHEPRPYVVQVQGFLAPAAQA